MDEDGRSVFGGRGKLDKWGELDNRGTLTRQMSPFVRSFDGMQSKNATVETEDSPEPTFKLQNLKLGPARRSRNGKIARLPLAIREAVNQMLLDGLVYPQIVAKLQQLGYPGIRPQNLSEWRKGGYQDWLRRREQQEDLQQDRLAAIAMAKDPASRMDVEQANEFLVGLRICEALVDQEPSSLADFFKVADAVLRHSREQNRRNAVALAQQRHTDAIAGRDGAPRRPQSSTDEKSDHIRPNPTQ